MKKMLAILGSIGLTSTAASAVIACGNSGNSNIGSNRSIMVNPDITNGSYDKINKTFRADWGSDQYQNHQISFSLKKITLKAENIQVATSTGVKLDQNSGLWSFKSSGKNTVFQIKNSSLNGATIQINSPKYAPITFKIIIQQIGDIVIGDVVNGFYQASTNTFVASHQTSKYDTNKMSFVLLGITLTNDDVQVKTSDQKITTGVKLETKGEDTIITIDDYHLNGATIQIKDGDKWWPEIFKIVIGQDEVITVNSEVRNGSYDIDNQTFTAAYGSSKYNDNHMIFSLKDLPLTQQNIVVKDSSGMVVDKANESWDFWTAGDGNSAVIEIKDWNLNGATIEIKDVDGYWGITFKVVIIQDKHLVIENVTNGSYDAITKTFKAASGNSTYSNHKMSFAIKDFLLDTKFILLRDENADQVNVNRGWSFSYSDNDTIITIDDYHLNNAKLFVWNLDGYWNGVFNIVIPQDQIFTPDVVNGSYDAGSQTLTASYELNEYDTNKMSFALNGVSLIDANVVVTTSNKLTTTTGWSLTSDGEKTTITIDDYHLNGATITIKNIDGYWPITFKLRIGKEIVVNEGVVNGSYDATTQTFTSRYSNIYNPLTFSLANVVLENKQILVKDAQGNVVDVTTGRWDFWISDDQKNTVIRIDDSNLNGATLEIQNVNGYWPITFKFVIEKQVVVNEGVVNGSYDATTQTFTHNQGDYLIFSLKGIHLYPKDLVVLDNNAHIIKTVQNPELWKLWYAGDDESNTVFQFNVNSNWNSAFLQIDLDGYSPIIFRIVIS